MGRRPEQTFFQRKHTDDQQAHEKILNIANQRNANQTHNEIPLHTCENDYQKKRTQIQGTLLSTL